MRLMDLPELSVAGGMLILLVLTLRILFLHHLPKWTFPALWHIAALRLLIPFTLPVPAPLGGLPALSISRSAAAAETGPLPAIAAGLQAVSNPRQSPAVPAPWTALWLTGVCLLGAHFVVSYVRGVRRFRESLPCRDEAVLRWLGEHRLRRTIHVRVSERIGSPLTYSVLHPVILLPKGLNDLDEDCLRAVLTHEYVHIRRLDAAAKLLYAAVLCVWWFHPLVWLMFRLAGRDLELCCDECVITLLGEREKAPYAHTLLHMAERGTDRFPLCSHLVKTRMEERIEAIMKWKKHSALAAILTICTVAGMSTVSAASPAPVPTDSMEPLAAVAATGSGAAGSQIVIDGEPGDIFTVGDLIFEIVAPEEAAQAAAAAQTRASTQRWGISLSGTSMSKDFEVTSNYCYAKVWIDNSGSGNLIFTITRGSPTGSVVSGSSVTIAAGTSTSVYSTNKWPADTYYANFTSGKAGLSGTAACRVDSIFQSWISDPEINERANCQAAIRPFVLHFGPDAFTSAAPGSAAPTGAAAGPTSGTGSAGG